MAQTYIHANHPDTGLDVVFVPGELLPEWVTLKPDEDTERPAGPRGSAPAAKPRLRKASAAQPEVI